MMSNTVTRLAACSLALAILTFVGGCPKQELPKVTVVAMIDVSGSTTGAKGIRDQWSSEIQQALKAFADDSPGNASFTRAASITVASVTENSVASGAIIQKELPASAGLLGVHSEEKDARAKAVNECLSFVRKTLDASAGASDIMSAMNRAGKYFVPADKSPKLLLLFSDMVEQTPRYDFASDNLTQSRAKQIIEKEKSENRLPSLQGVQVWVSGFAAADAHGLSAGKIQQIQDFWIAYFQAAGANIDASRIDRILSNFSIPRN